MREEQFFRKKNLTVHFDVFFDFESKRGIFDSLTRPGGD